MQNDSQKKKDKIDKKNWLGWNWSKWELIQKEIDRVGVN